MSLLSWAWWYHGVLVLESLFRKCFQWYIIDDVSPRWTTIHMNHKKNKILESQPLLGEKVLNRNENRGWVKTEGRSCLKSIFFFAIEDVMLCYEIGYLQLFIRALFSLAPAAPQVGLLSWLVQALLFETTNSWGVMWRHWPNSSSESTEKKSPLDRLSLLTWLGYSDAYTYSTCRFISKRSVVRGWLPLLEINASTK